MDDQKNRQEATLSLSALFSTGARLAGLLVKETLRQFVTINPSTKAFPASKALARILEAPVLALFFLANAEQGVALVPNLVFVGILGFVGELSLRSQPDARYSTAFMSVMLVGVSFGQILTVLRLPGIFQAAIAAWTLVIIIRMSMAVWERR